MLVLASKFGNVVKVRQLLASGININEKDEVYIFIYKYISSFIYIILQRGYTALVDACKNGHYVTCKLLLSRGANPNLIDTVCVIVQFFSVILFLYLIVERFSTNRSF